jgi:SsrA-binding protein
MKSKDSPPATIATNRTARRDYQILDTLEAGMVLQGSEVKSIRAGHVNLKDAFARIEKGELWLYQCDVSPYAKSTAFNHEARRVRKLLLHRREIDKLYREVEVAGRTLVALEMYWKNGHVKLRLGVGVGKTHRDQREDLKSADARREIERAMKQARRR